MADISKITVDGVTYNVKDETARRVDDALSAASTNPVQNKVVYSALAGLQGAMGSYITDVAELVGGDA